MNIMYWMLDPRKTIWCRWHQLMVILLNKYSTSLFKGISKFNEIDSVEDQDLQVNEDYEDWMH